LRPTPAVRPCLLTTSFFQKCLLATLLAALIVPLPVGALAQDQPSGNSANTQVAKAVGVIKSLQANSITIASESGGELTATLAPTTKILRVPPGEKDLKNATPLQAQDLQPGDRVLVRGQTTNGDAHTIAALAVIVMKQSDVAARQQHDRDDWQKRGVGGLVTKVDPAADTITISSGGLGTTRNIVILISKDTVLRRYAPGSVKFDDAKSASLDEVKVGDQLRARGTRNPEGTELAADEVVSGSFRNIAGTIKSIDAAASSMTVQDAITKSPVVVKISADSQMKKLPPEMAQRIATRLKAAGVGAGDPKDGTGQNPGGIRDTTGTQGASAASGGSHSGAGSPAPRGPGGSGPPDFQRMLSRLPNAQLSDLQKGDAVMMVSTQAGDSGMVTAITLLAGVDAILTAAPNRSASSLLSPWSLGAPGGEGEAAPQ